MSLLEPHFADAAMPVARLCGANESTAGANRSIAAGSRPMRQLQHGLVDGSIAPTSLSTGEALSLIREAKRSVGAAQQKIRAEHERHRFNIARRKVSALMRALPARLVAASEAASKTRRSQGDAWTFADIWACTERLRDLTSPSHARVTMRDKKRGGRRPICAFSIQDKARQHLMRLCLTPFASFHPSQFGLRRGRSVACETLLQQLNAARPETCVAQIDVKNFFGSISHEWLEENLPLPRGIIRAILHTGGMSLSPSGRGRARTSDEDIQEVARRGIPQGSAASPLVAEIVMSHLLGGLTDHLPGGVLINYSDNTAFVFEGRQGEWHAIVERFRRALSEHPAGPFSITASAAQPVATGFRFLGYEWRKRGDIAEARVDPIHLADRVMNFRRDILDAPCIAPRVPLAIHRYRIRGYEGAFSLCPDTRREIAMLMAELDEG